MKQTLIPKEASLPFYKKIQTKLLAAFLITALVFSSGGGTLMEEAGARFLSTTVAPGEFKTARKGFTANLITTGPNKGQVLIAGGFDGTNYLDTAERFNPATGTFVSLHASLGKMSKKRAYHSSVALSDGKILLIGGYEASSTLLGSMEIYDPTTDRFTTRNGVVDLPTLITPRAYHTSTVVPDPLDSTSSVVLIAGGYDGTAYTNKAETFTLSTNAIAATANDMLTARGYHAAQYFPSTGTSSKGTVLMIGGTNDTVSGTPVARGAQEYYDVNARQFITAGITMTEARVGMTVTDFSATATPNLLVAGGQKNATQYSMTADRISHNGTVFTIASIPTQMGEPRKGATAVVNFEDSNSTNKKVYIIGGNNGSTDLTSFETFDVTSVAFTATSSQKLAVARKDAVGIKLPLTTADGGTNNNGQIVLIGGSSATYPIIRSVEFLDTQNYQETPMNMLYPRSDFAAIEITDDQLSGSHYTNYGKILIVGGKKNGAGWAVGDSRFEVELYDPATNKFTDLCLSGRNSTTGRCTNPAYELTDGRYGFTHNVLPNGQIVFIGGINELGLVNSIEIFNPQTSTFSRILPATSLNRAHHQATVISNDEILITGGTTMVFGSYVGACPSYGARSMVTNNTALIYKVSTQSIVSTWNGVTPIGNHTARYGHRAHFLNGKVYLIGGGTNVIDEYNPSSGTFTSVSTSGPTQSFGTSQISTDISGNSKLIFAGGAPHVVMNTSAGISACGAYHSRSDILVAGTNSNASIIDMSSFAVRNIALSQSMGAADMVQLANGQFMLSGSFRYEGSASNRGSAPRTTIGTQSANALIIDPLTETSFPVPGAMKNLHGAHKLLMISDKAGLVNKNKVLILGGLNTTLSETPSNKAELYDPGNFSPDIPEDDTGFFVPQNNQEFITHQPSLKFHTSDIEGDHLKYQVQITDRLLSFPFDDFEVTNEASLLWNFIQANEQSGFKGMDGFDGQYFKNNTLAELDLASTSFFLPNGEYKMRVRAIDPTGSHEYSAWGPSNAGGQYNFTVNAEEGLPTVRITNPVNQIYNSTTGLLPFLGTAEDTGVGATGVKKIMVALKDETGGTWWNDTSTFSMPTETYFEANGTTNWNYPRSGTITFTDGHVYSVKAYAVDNAGNVGTIGTPITFLYDSAFVPMTLTLSSPNGGENLGVGTPHTITWTATGGVADHFEISYSKDDFVTETLIDDAVSGGLSSYAWMVPNDVSTTVKVRLIAKNVAGYTIGTDDSNTQFEISTNGGDVTAPVVTIITPQDNSNVTSISSITGTYTDGGTVNAIKISIKNKTTGLYYDGTGGFTSTPEVKNTVATVTSPWTYDTTTLPFVDGVEYEIKAYVTDAGGNEGIRTITVGHNMPVSNGNTNSTNTNQNGNGNTNTTVSNTNTNSSGQGTTSTPTTTQPIVVVTSGGGGGPVYPIYPSTPAPSQTTQSSGTGSSGNTQDTTAPTTSITYPPNGATLTSLSSIQGVASDGTGAGVGYVLVSFRDDTTGKYFDGTGFSGNDKMEFKAIGEQVWSLDVPPIFTPNHAYTIAVRGVDKAGNTQSLPSQVKIQYGSTANTNPAVSATESLPTGSGLQDGTTSVPTSSGDQQLAEVIKTLQQVATKPVAPVNVQVSQPKTTSPAVVSSSSTGTQKPQELPTNTNGNTNGGTVEDVQNAADSYDDQYAQYLKDHPESAPSDEKYDTIGLRDTDNDGLSDQQELKGGTDPFRRDTDGDSFSDGEEVLEYATNPLDPNDKPGLKGVTITNLNTGTTTPDQRPFITGFAKPGSNVVLYDIKPDGTKHQIGTAVADSRGRYVLTPTEDLEKGKHFLAAGILDADGKVVDMSPVKTMDIDPSLEVPVPEVEDIKVLSKKPHVFGKTLYGTTVVGQFQSLVTTSSIVADTTTGDFVVVASTALEEGPHKVTLYAILPNGVRSKTVTVPFTVGDKESSLRQSALKADIASAPGNVWWLIGSLLPLLLLALLLLYYFMHKRDTVVYSLTRKEVGIFESSKIGDAHSYTSKLGLTRQDLSTEYVAFYLNRSDTNDHTALGEFKNAQEGTIFYMGKILDIKYLDSANEYLEVAKEDIDMKRLMQYHVRYIMEQISVEGKILPEFYGKKYFNSNKLVDDIAFVQTSEQR